VSDTLDHADIRLTGLSTIRAYGETKRFIDENAYYMDLEDRAYLLTATNQRWLSIRLDFLGGCLVFALAVMAAKGAGGVSSSQIALCLTYMTTITQVLGMVTRQTAEVENNSESWRLTGLTSVNAVERVLWYADKSSLPQEPAHEIAATRPADAWPQQGAISFDKVVMSYRPGLPAVLKGMYVIQTEHG
jgi:ABC-type multidrug transport system fused ATPase/permease subunit